jgi:hypothetical protein
MAGYFAIFGRMGDTGLCFSFLEDESVKYVFIFKGVLHDSGMLS